MNKYQKELLQNSLKDEKKVLSDLRKTYEQAEKDIDARIEDLLARFNATDDANLQRTIIYQVDYQKALKKQISGILDNLNGQQFNTISDYIRNCYEDGFIGTLYDLQGQGVPLIFPIDQEQVTTAIAKETKLSKSLYSALGEDVADLKKRVQNELSRGIAQNHSYAQMARNIKNQTTIGYNRAARIARTEGHRVQQAAQADAQLKAKEAGADVVKQWDSTLDGRTRNAHRALDGQIRELDEPFEINGHKAQYPGDFGIPGQDIHCRCVTLTRARWAVDDETEATKFDNETGQLVEIESKNYQDFKKKYYDNLFSTPLGKSITTPNGTVVTRISTHAWKRMMERGATIEEIEKALTQPINSDISEVRFDKSGRRSQRFIGEEATVNVNPDNHIITTTWKTGSATIKKWQKVGKKNVQ